MMGDSIRKVLVISRFHAPMRNTRAIQAERAVNSMRSSGLDVRVISEGTDSFSSRGRFNRLIAEIGLYLNWTGLAWHGARKSRRKALQDDWRPDCVLSMSTPFDSHLLGYDLARSFGVPWVAFLSDPWPIWTAPGPYKKPGTSLYHRRQYRCADRLLRKCNALLAPTAEMLQLAREVYPGLAETPAVETLHCVSSESRPPAVIETTGIYHIGEIITERCSDELISAIKSMAKSLQGEKDVLTFIGKVVDEFKVALSEETQRGIVRFLPPVSLERSQELMRSANALLIVEADADASPCLLAKSTDYAAAQRPIIIISNADSAQVRIMGGHTGVHCVPHDAKLIAEQLVEAHKQPLEASTDLAAMFAPDKVAARYMEGLRLALEHYSAE